MSSYYDEAEELADGWANEDDGKRMAVEDLRSRRAAPAAAVAVQLTLILLDRGDNVSDLITMLEDAAWRDELSPKR